MSTETEDGYRDIFDYLTTPGLGDSDGGTYSTNYQGGGD